MKDDRCEGGSHYGCKCTGEPRRTWATDIYDMHEHYGAHAVDFDGNFLEFRGNFLKEELREFFEAIDNNEPQKAVDALVDLCVVAIGTLDLGGVDTDKAWDEVLDKNMKKETGENSTRPGSGGFDLVKPEGWTPPNHEGNTGYFDSAIEQLLKKREVLKEQNLLDNGIPSHVRTIDRFREFALSKDNAYNGNDTDESHASYYPDGIDNIAYELFKKIKRLRNGLKKFKQGNSNPLVEESLHDGFRDISIYSAIGDTYMRGELEGQIPSRDIFNQEK